MKSLLLILVGVVLGVALATGVPVLAQQGWDPYPHVRAERQGTPYYPGLDNRHPDDGKSFGGLYNPAPPRDPC